MIHDARLDLTVPYARKEEAKALGARWDSTRRTWYAPAGTDLRGFDERWLPKGFGLHAEQASSPDESEVRTDENGITLSELLARIKGVVTQGMPESVWVRAEISEMSGKNGNIYLQLTERNERGDPLGKVKGIIWRGQAVGITSKFLEATGEGLRTDIKILCLVQVRFDVLYGLDLIIEDVDPSYTLGDLAAKLARIRQRLAEERVLNRNQCLPAPVEFLRVAVISPETSAGLGDFRRETDRLQRRGLCDFEFFRATFQGMDAPSSIRTAVNEVLASHRQLPFDALIIIRGGGSVTDLAWLNDWELARMICLAPIPVLTGIGHERDSTILDEVAHRRFDTPSKVALHITSTIRDNALAAVAAFDRIKLHVARILTRERDSIATQVERLNTETRSVVRQAESNREKSMVVIRTTTFYRLRQEQASVVLQAEKLGDGVGRMLRRANEASEELASMIRTSTRFHLREAERTLGAERLRTVSAADQVACEAGFQLKSAVDGVTHRARFLLSDQAAGVDRAADVIALKSEAAVEAVKSHLEHGATEIQRESRRLVVKASAELECGYSDVGTVSFAMVRGAGSLVAGHVRLVVGLGPQSTLQRGFSIAKSIDGHPITSREAASKNAEFTVQFQDGAVRVTNLEYRERGSS